MTPSKFRYRGKSPEEMKEMSADEFRSLLKSRHRRSLKRGLTEQQKNLLENIRKNPSKFHRTHCRDILVLPEMMGVKLGVHNGKEYVSIQIRPEMLGHRLCDLVSTRRMVKRRFVATVTSRLLS